MDIAMAGGFGLALAAGIVFLLIDRINRSEMDAAKAPHHLCDLRRLRRTGRSHLPLSHMSWIASNG